MLSFKIHLSYDDRHAPIPWYWSAEGTSGATGHTASWIDAMYEAMAALQKTAQEKANQQRAGMRMYQTEADALAKFIPDHARELLK
jgi:hypothetical protein